MAKKYGLIWENDPKKVDIEDVIERCKTEVPVLREIKGKRLERKDTGPDQTVLDYDPNKQVKSPTHLLIEGDNYHTLTSLNYTHREKIDVIYIDPPYNTGNKDFMYNDRMVGGDDSYRHSKWLSFMNIRLKLAKNLLKDTGVMFISIDDHEQAQLKLLCDKVFGESNVETMIWEKTGHGKKGGTGKSSAGNTARSEHEYIIACYKSIQNIRYNKILELPNFVNKKTNQDDDVRGPWESGNISASQATQNINSPKYYSVASPTGKKFTRQWLSTKEKFALLENDNRIYWGKHGNAVPRIKIFINEEREVIPGSIIKDRGSLTYGKDELEEILGYRLDNFTPKPTALIKHLVSIVEPVYKNAIILDFFAGSGTTGHTVLQLNKEDSGSRQFILSTNNENNICTDVCYPRIVKAMKGYKTPRGKKIEGLGSSLKYYKTAFEKRTRNTDQMLINIARASRDILRAKSSIHNLVISDMNKQRGHYEVFEQNKKYMAIYYALDCKNSFDELKNILNALKNHDRTLYFLILDPNGAMPGDFDGWDKDIRIEPIPHKLLNIYDMIFRDRK